ncbi:MAG TPA: hypothetical protein VGR86_16300 [Steroidobacteraceae bacterium]|nr:hypothetical protein [Steroidobacteraceae bacterium]
MRTRTTAGPTMPSVLQQPPALRGMTEPGIFSCELPARSSEPPAEHDATLLVAALEHLEVQRAAIEWLADADLLHLCLV